MDEDPVPKSSRATRTPVNRSAVRAAAALPVGEYFFFAGDLSAQKGLLTLLEAYPASGSGDGIHARAGRVLASLWPVGDRIALEFMTTFYAALRAGVAPSLALKTAQDLLRRDHPHPFYWAAFVL